MRISELAQLTGVTVHALRHYERAGLLVPRRQPNGYRDYAASARRAVVFITMSRALGFGLPQIRQALAGWRSGRMGPGALADAVATRADDIQAQITALQAQHRLALDHARWLRTRQAEQDAASASRPPQPQRPPWPRVRRALSSDPPRTTRPTGAPR